MKSDEKDRLFDGATVDINTGAIVVAFHEIHTGGPYRRISTINFVDDASILGRIWFKCDTGAFSFSRLQDNWITDVQSDPPNRSIIALFRYGGAVRIYVPNPSRPGMYTLPL